jgi:hypothetical protein
MILRMRAPAAHPSTSRAWYVASVDEFLVTPSDSIIGQLASSGGATVLQTQIGAWHAQIDVLRDQLRGLTGTVAFEFMIPRMGRRIDVVVRPTAEARQPRLDRPGFGLGIRSVHP